ncbi:thioredoxin reductase [Streptococcus mutans]|nr:hypothetical protein [Streptococcus mutans]EMC22624.1 thioredoxin reductase [Streptococcus mutans SF1]AVM72308.1 thioredoxin reductase [Streptococcus mutans]EMC44634.1 thioredoxin reductase [Streptococcus mutans SM4]MCB5048438.1 thioredoxin reductase [Streptococcus mutans]MCB5158256.1 thioredoxin reductase [Streptococcus mutans]
MLKASSVDIMTPYVPLEIIRNSQKVTNLIIRNVKSDNVIDFGLDVLIISFVFSTFNKNLKDLGVDYRRSSIQILSSFETS